MKTEVKQLSNNTYLITFGIFESSKMLNVSYRTIQTIYSFLRNQYKQEDMYGRFVDRATREKYDGHDHHDLAVSPDYVIRAGNLRMDSEEAIVSVKLEVINPSAFGGTLSDFELGFNNWGWTFVPRCYTIEDTDEFGFNVDQSYRAYVGLPEERQANWNTLSSTDYRTIDIWHYVDTEDCPTEDPVQEEPKPATTKIVVDKSQAELIKVMLSSGFNFTMTIGDTEVEFLVTDKTEPKEVPVGSVAAIRKHIDNMGSPHNLAPGYNGATFTPEQPKPVSVDPTRSMWGPE